MRTGNAKIRSRLGEFGFPGAPMPKTHSRAVQLHRVQRFFGGPEAVQPGADGKLALGPEVIDRILRVARTIADLSGSAAVAAKQVAEAVQYRSLDRDYWS